MKTRAHAIADPLGTECVALWQQRAGRPDAARRLQLDGRRVLTLESRRSPELALLVMNYGGTPVVAPSLREVPLESNHQALAFAEDLIEQRFGMVVLMTGVGVRLLVKIVEPVYGRETFVRALAQTRIVARGPKPVAALREIGLAPWVTVPSPNTWRELLATLDARIDEAPLDDVRVAVQEYGLANPELVAGLAARGADVVTVPIYRWSMPEDVAPLRSAVQAIVRRRDRHRDSDGGDPARAPAARRRRDGARNRRARGPRAGGRGLDRADDLRGAPASRDCRSISSRRIRRWGFSSKRSPNNARRLLRIEAMHSAMPEAVK